LAASTLPFESNDPIQKAVSVAALTDIGMRRRNNQDSMAIHLADGRAAWERSGHLFIVADGMGAHAAGELASRLAVDLIQHHYEKQQQPRPIENLHRAVIEANNEIFRRGQANIEFRNMGTTCSVLALCPEGAICAHVGDSRIYRLRGSLLEQLTFDHSLVWEMNAAGGIDDETLQSSTIPKNVITRSLGPNASVLIDLEGPMPIQKGDKFLLCSDGLSGQLTDCELGVLMELLTPLVAAQAMLDLANLRGGPDNITLIIAEVVGDEIVTKSDLSLAAARSPNSLPPFPWPFAVVAAICFLAAPTFLIVRQVPLAVTVGLVGLLALLIGAIRFQSSRPSTIRDSQHHGRSPYRRFQCAADMAMVERLSGTIQALREAAVENHWSEAVETVDRLRPEGETAEQTRNFSAAVRSYATTIVESMKQIRSFRQISI
jgi:protein phosphatase